MKDKIIEILKHFEQRAETNKTNNDPIKGSVQFIR